MPDTHDDTTPKQWVEAVARAARGIGDYAVDITALAAIYGLASTQTPEASTQVLAGAIVTVALGKRAADAYRNR